MGKEKISWSELLGVIATIGILATIMLPALVRAREAARQAYCVNNLKQWGVIFSMYDGESPNGLWPVVNQASGHPGRVCDPASITLSGELPLRGVAGRSFMPYPPSVYPEYMEESSILICPSSSAQVEQEEWIEVPCDNQQIGWGAWDRSYRYYGWFMDKLAQKESFPNSSTLESEQFLVVLSYIQGVGEEEVYSSVGGGLDPHHSQLHLLDSNIDSQSEVASVGLAKLPYWQRGSSFSGGLGNSSDNIARTWGSNEIFRLQTGLSRFFVTDVNNPSTSTVPYSSVAVMSDVMKTKKSFSHLPRGGNILYMDGHVEFVSFPGKDFASESAIATLAFVDQS